MEELEKPLSKGTEEFVFNQTMMRIKDPKDSLEFYVNVLGMTLIKKLDFPEMEFTLYFLGYLRDADDPVPSDPVKRAEYAFCQKAMLELTHNYGTEMMTLFRIMMVTAILEVLVILELLFRMFTKLVKNLKKRE